MPRKTRMNGVLRGEIASLASMRPRPDAAENAEQVQLSVRGFTLQ